MRGVIVKGCVEWNQINCCEIRFRLRANIISSQVDGDESKGEVRFLESFEVDRNKPENSCNSSIFASDSANRDFLLARARA